MFPFTIVRHATGTTRVALMVAILVLAGAAQTPKQTEESVGHALIAIFDKKGTAVSATKSDLVLSVDGKPVEIQELTPVTGEPLDFAVLIDFSGSNRDKAAFEKDAARQIFQALSKDKDRGYLGVFNDRTWIAEAPLRAQSVEPTLKNLTNRGGTALYQALVQATQRLERADVPATRRVIFVISDGEDNASQISAVAATQAMQRSHVALFGLELKSSYAHSKHMLRTMARATGGHVIEIDHPENFIDALIAPLNSQYMLAFTRPRTLPDAVMAFTIKPVNRSLSVLAPTEYIAPPR